MNRNPLSILCQQMKLPPELVARWTKITPDKAAAALATEPPNALDDFIKILVALKCKIRVEAAPFAVTFDYAGIDALLRDNYWRDQIGMNPWPHDRMDQPILTKPRARDGASIPADMTTFRRHVVSLLLVRLIPSDPRVPTRFGVELAWGEAGVTFRWERMPTCVRERIEKGLENLGWFRDQCWRIEQPAVRQ
jgi:hypothetical protein